MLTVCNFPKTTQSFRSSADLYGILWNLN